MKRLALFAFGIAILLTTATRAAEQARLDWSDWELVPVFYDGRVMPLDTFAREFVGRISGRESPRLDLRNSVTKAEYESPELAEARSLFPDGKERKFPASQLLMSWLLEPDKWERVPFLQAKHEELRKFLELPLKNENGQPLAFVSPHQLRECQQMVDKIRELIDKEKEARANGTELQLNELDRKVRELGQAFTAWQGLILDPKPKLASNAHFARAFIALYEQWQASAEELGMFAKAGGASTGLAKPFSETSEAFETIAKLAQSPDIAAADLDAPVRKLDSAMGDMADQMHKLNEQMAEHPPAGIDRANLARLLDDVTSRTRRLADLARNARGALYESDATLRVVPALNAAALEKDRDTSNEAQPWLDLETLLYGSPAALADYPAGEVDRVRAAFQKLAGSYGQRNARPNDFAAAEKEFAQSLRALGQDVEPLRSSLPIKARDADLISYTKYPPAGATAIEVQYNRLQPFQWAWVINLLGTCVFVVYMIGIRRRGLFQAGLAILAVGLVWAAYGFYMRVTVTGWAPVTNMYETVIYVPFFVAALGTWFAILPVVWNGLKCAWRMTAVPGTWEATELSSEETRLAGPGTWGTMAAVLMVPRLALSALVFWTLAVAPYSAGGRTIINLLPNVDYGRSLPSFNDLMTWAVGLVVLLPAVWYVPRVIATGLLSLFVVPLNVRGRRAEFFNQMYARWPFCLAATFIAFFGSAVASYAPVLDPSFSPLQPVLRDNFWLLIHVLTIVSSYGAGALAWGLANIALGYYLFGKYRSAQPAMALGHRPLHAVAVPSSFVPARPPEEAAVLCGYVYKAMQVAVVLLAAGTILGALWADVAWGRFWGWDPKEVWALISLLVYLAILHGRYAGIFGNFGLCFGAVLGFSAIIMSWYGVNFVLGVGLHSYGFGQGGQLEVFGAVGLNWLYLCAATVRFLLRTKGTVRFWKTADERVEGALPEPLAN